MKELAEMYLENRVDSGKDLLFTNLFAYCANNPVMNEDANGYKWRLRHL